MSKKLPFEDAVKQQLNNLPTPGEDESWQKMKQLLDDKERRTPLAFFTSFKIWSLLVLLLITCVFFIFNSMDKAKEKRLVTSGNNVVLQQKSVTSNLHKNVIKTQTVNETPTIKPTVSNSLPKAVNNDSRKTDQHMPVASSKKIISHKENKQNAGTKSTISQVKTIFGLNKDKPNNWLIRRQNIVKKAEDAGIKDSAGLTKDNSTESREALRSFQKNNLPADKTSIAKPGLMDTLIPPQKDSLFYKKNTAIKEDSTNKKVALRKLKKYFVSAGIGVQQQIPVAGRQIVGYGYNGNSLFSDYIPSAYFRLEREKKWFLQGEFIYGAPQLLKAFAYSQHTQADSSGTTTTTTLRLKKTFYNEVPVTFNYYLSPNLSAGAGFTYSWLYGAIAEKEINTHNPLIPVNTAVQQVVPVTGYTDSFFYRSRTCLHMQADYQWRRLSLGVRYTKDVQPYIKYTMPDGAVASRKNWSLQFILRFRLWKSAQF